jgi:hypothetical protein
MRETTKKQESRNNNVRCYESGIGIYSYLINHAKVNGIKNTPNYDYEKLPEEKKKEWQIVSEKASSDNTIAVSPTKFYEMYADQIKFTPLHRIVLMVLEEIYNCQSKDNTYNWRKGKNGNDYYNQGKVYCNPTQLAQYIWGDAHSENVKKIGNILNDLSSEKVYLSRTEHLHKEKGNDISKYVIKEVNLIISREINIVTTKDGIKKEFYKYIQLHPIFFEGISNSYIRHRNNLYIKIRNYYHNMNNIVTNTRQKYKLPPESVINMVFYLSEFTRNNIFSLTLDEKTIAENIGLNDFQYRQYSRGKKKMATAFCALCDAGMIKQWEETVGVKKQTKYIIILNSDFFGRKETIIQQKEK